MSEPINTNDFESVRNAKVSADGFVTLPVVPLMHTVVYPNVISPILILDNVGRNAVQFAAEAGKTVIGAALRNPDIQQPGPEDLFTIGTELGLSLTQHRFDTREDTVLAQGRRRLEIVEYTQTEPYLIAKARLIVEEDPQTEEVDVLMRTVFEMFQHASELSENIPDDVIDYAETIFEPGWLADFIASTLMLTLEERQKILEMPNVVERLKSVAALLNRELNMLELRDNIAGQVQSEFAKNQRDAFLREQMRVIQNELGDGDPFQQDINELREQIAKTQFPPEVLERATKELSRLAAMQPMAPEVGIIRTYLDWIVGLPWATATEDNLDLKNALRVLDDDHYGLKKIKDRILEHIAVRKLAADKQKTPILCFVGPPGVGKTSLGRSIARALGRNFVRVSLGGVRDEAEIRGHRRTYIGALPGRILHMMKRAGTVNPVFMLDEIDKLGADFRGDPSSALLEVLDPEQNNEFSDHYLDLPYDLSKVMFITTANDLSPLPEALLDRMEIIEFPGYTEEEKAAIADQYLVPQQLEANGLADMSVRIGEDTIKALIREYTYEAGVRSLNREIGNVCRKIARAVAENRRSSRKITPDTARKLLGPPPFLENALNREDSVGLATGLAWTPGGGDTLMIEVSVIPGKGTLMLTGSLGEVMQESAQAAMSYMRAHAADFNVPDSDFEDFDVHVHVPEGAVPKDGPSAGITLAAAIISAFSERKIRANVALTGEITLRGRVLPVGGIKEKVLAAHRAKIDTLILPKQNDKDLIDIPAKTLKQLKIHLVENMSQVIDLLLLDAPAKRKRDSVKPVKEKKPKAAATGEPKVAKARSKAKTTPEQPEEG